ncbi:YgaP family membrane protein [Thiomicrolovo sp. ZZH C-3]|uniref:YgaP family membrane protein n=1 Tax=Sulfurimonas sp. ST-25 TaxID=3400151 RepID=UPI003A8AEEC1
MNVIKIRKFCRPFRIALGAALIGYGAYSGNPWFYLGVIPFIAGIMNFCPLCKITGQCNII